MPRASEIGKASRKFLHRVVYPKLGAKRPGTLVGPRFGVDNAVVRIDGGRVLVATTDPLSFIPSLQPRESAWLSVHLLASDLTTSGFPPQYGIFDFNLPPTMKDSEFAKYWRGFHHECQKLGVSIVGGHTGRFQGCDYTIIGGGVMWSIGPADRYLSSNMAWPGDDLVLTKGAAVGTTAILARAFPRTVKKRLGTELFQKAWAYIHKMTTVGDALTAITVGVRSEGVTAMHDATEGGVTAAALELAEASGLGIELDLTRLLVSEETREICNLFRIDPLTSLSEGTLLIACRPEKTSSVLKKLAATRIEAWAMGRLTSKARSYYATGPRGRARVRYPRLDPYWKAFWSATSKGWD